VITFEPSKLIAKKASKRKIKRLLKKDLSLKKAALSFASDIDGVSKQGIERIALKTIKGYKERIAQAIIDGDLDPSEGSDLKKEIFANPKQLIQRVQNEVLLQITSEIKEKYAGEFYIWLPSDANEPDPEHQLNYGKEFQIGVGEMPAERYGCRCGMQILVKDSTLKL
jgi:hypothetical protein